MKKFALVTGAADRIGKAFALALAHIGYDIFLHYNTSNTKAEETKRLIEKKGRQCILKQANFEEKEEVSRLIPDCQKQGDIEMVINNASRFVKSDIQTEGTALLEELYSVNFVAPYLLTKQFARHCGRGQLINIIDTKINQYQTEHLDYLLTKKSLEHFTHLSAVQLAPDIRVNGIAPGLVLPPEGESGEYVRERAEEVPLRQSGTLEQLTKTLRFLIDNPFVTGEVIHVDGGEHLS